MKYVGIVFAISRSAGEYLEQQIRTALESGSIDCSILTDEQPSERYQQATNLKEISNILFESIKIILKNIPEDEKITIILGANSVHAAFHNLKKLLKDSTLDTKINLISMIDATVEKTVLHGYKKVTVLGSTKTINSRLYHLALENSNIDIINLDSEGQARINTFITKGISNLTSDQTQELVTIVQSHVRTHSIDAIIFGCAELGEKFSADNLKCPIVNSTDALISTTVDLIIAQTTFSSMGLSHI